VATYDLQPQMSAKEITGCVIEEIRRQVYDVIMINFANPDMVGHTGVLSAAVEAVNTVDECVSQIAAYVLEYDGSLIITSDHGNCEKMYDEETQSPHTAHTTSKVPFVLVASQYKHRKLREGGALCDVAPTLLEVLSIPQPIEMTGVSLLI
jgi:2,3-bisphosphoglycerate-independent phosphoglycerate mutase